MVFEILVQMCSSTFSQHIFQAHGEVASTVQTTFSEA